MNDKMVHCCAECGEEGGVSLKACKSCMVAKYCNVNCQKNHWPKHKNDCKLRAAEIRDEALFKDPPAKEECPICFVPMPVNIISCASLPAATIKSVPIFDYARANEELANLSAETYHSCCGKYICSGCVYSLCKSVNSEKCPFCKAEIMKKSDNERLQEMMKRVEANDAGAIHELGCYYYNGEIGLLQDRAKAMQLWTQAVKLGSSKAHYNLGNVFYEGGDIKKAKFHFGAAAVAGHEEARSKLGGIEGSSGNVERAIKHWKIAASAGHFHSMDHLRTGFEQGVISRDAIDSTLTAYNSSCKEMRSEARDAFIGIMAEINGRGT